MFIQEQDHCYPDNQSLGVALGPNNETTTCATGLVGAGFIVGRSNWVIDVPFDRYIPWIFHGEELL
jgi:hypothetical protein